MKRSITLAALGLATVMGTGCSDDATVDEGDADEPSAEQVGTVEQAVKLPLWLGSLPSGPYATYCYAGQYPLPCGGYQARTVSCTHQGQTCRCRQVRNGSVSSGWYFTPRDSFHTNIIDCR